MRPDTDLGAHCDPHDGCITLALCEDASGRRETVEIALVAPVTTRGDRLLVHAGTAIARTA